MSSSSQHGGGGSEAAEQNRWATIKSVGWWRVEKQNEPTALLVVSLLEMQWKVCCILNFDFKIRDRTSLCQNQMQHSHSVQPPLPPFTFSSGLAPAINHSVILKVGMVGDSQIGKTSLMVRYVEGSFNEDYIQTLGKCWSLSSSRCWACDGQKEILWSEVCYARIELELAKGWKVFHRVRTVRVRNHEESKDPYVLWRLILSLVMVFCSCRCQFHGEEHFDS